MDSADPTSPSGLNGNPQTDGDRSGRRVHLWELPDTSILFRRYLDAGRMINVHDWYESFGQALDTQREQAKERAEEQMKEKSKGKGKEKRKASTVANEGEVDEEAWRVQVQARFMRALHELDYLGFIKHTGRKADHIMKTVFDLPE